MFRQRLPKTLELELRPFNQRLDRLPLALKDRSDLSFRQLTLELPSFPFVPGQAGDI